MKYLYQVFGLVIQSDLALPNLKAAKNKSKINVRIEAGEIDPKDFSAFKEQALYAHTSRQKLWLRIPNVAVFLVTKGTKIIYQPEQDADLQSIALFILGNCMAALLHQQAFIVLRAMAVKFGDEAVIFASKPGDGKTLLAASLHKKGYQVLCDDLCVIDSTGLVHPGYPWLKLWRDCFNVMEIAEGELVPIRAKMEKYFYPLGSSHVDKALPFRRMYLMGVSNQDGLIITQIDGLKKLIPMKAQIYDLQNVIAMGLFNEKIKLLMKLAGKTTLRWLVRPQQIKVASWIEQIEADVCK